MALRKCDALRSGKRVGDSRVHSRIRRPDTVGDKLLFDMFPHVVVHIPIMSRLTPRRTSNFMMPAFCQAYKELVWFIQKMCDARLHRKYTKAALLLEMDKRQPASRDWIMSALDKLPA